MRVLSIDPGATRLGWALLEGDPSERDENKPPIRESSGYFGLERELNGGKAEPYQHYRLRLIDYWVTQAEILLHLDPDILVSEIVPVVGGGNFVAATQSQLASTAITVIHTVARQQAVPVEQIGATTIKARIGGHKKATKVKVRNGVFTILPETKQFKSKWVKIFEEPDALATGLTHLGYDVRERQNGRI